VLARRYGLADRHDHRSVTRQSLLRIASLSKPFTSAAIFALVELGRLRTGDRGFGASGILRTVVLRRHADWLQAISIEHLLAHTARGWPNKERDPMFHEMGRNRTHLLQETLDSVPLEPPPGTGYAYSNFGYFVLGRVIEQIFGVPYGEHVQ
jgi:D-alanyl-D-alanine carboxypeptidase